MSRILVVDDDPVVILLLRKILTLAGHEASCYDDPRVLLAAFEAGKADLILSDMNMPGMNGDELIEAVRGIDGEVPFVMLTASTEIATVVRSFKVGAQDYLCKPIVAEDLLHRIRAVIDEAGLKREVARVTRERDLIEREYEQLVNWRKLYAFKDITQTEQMIKLFIRSVNAAGGYMWLDLLGQLPRNEEGGLVLKKDIVTLILESAGAQRKTFDFLTFVSQLPSLELSFESQAAAEFIRGMAGYVKSELLPLAVRSGRTVGLSFNEQGLPGTISADRARVRDILKELVINAIKYSPEGARILIDVSHADPDLVLKGKAGSGSLSETCFAFTVQNPPKLLQAHDKADRQVSGLPYEFSELVFDLFFTIEAFPTSHPEEDWVDGSGLFVARSLAKRMGGWIENRSVIDHTGARPQPLVQFVLLLPVTKQ